VGIAVGPVIPNAVFALGSKPSSFESVSNQISIVQPRGQMEACSSGHIYTAPSGFTDETGRLQARYREVAQRANPWENLKEATLAFALGQDALGRALSDLSVSGKKSYQEFKRLHAQGRLNETDLIVDITFSPFGAAADEGGARAQEEVNLRRAARRALQRAYQAAHGIYARSEADRWRLGYIAVSGEDDAPRRPINTSATHYPQYDMTLRVQGQRFRVRYTIADTMEGPTLWEAWNREWTLPTEPRPQKLNPEARVLFYIHGMDSRFEEAEDLIRALREITKKTGERWVVVSMDLPSSGYSDYLDPLALGPIEESGHAVGFPQFFDARSRQHVPVLDFLEETVVTFLDELDRSIHLKGQLEAVIGGSLGGNLTFRLGRRTDLPWLKNVVSWSAASIWESLAGGADPFKHLGVATAWKRAGGDIAELIEHSEERAQFFFDSFESSVGFGPIQIVPAQPDQWWDRRWPCSESAREIARLERQEIYSRHFRLWHWRLAMEQLIYTQQTSPELGFPRYQRNIKRMLLACGQQDDFSYTNICSTTMQVARKMTETPGRTVLFHETGHSIHNERPAALAREIIAFLQ
jgi:pimeloyl-ACP methyl ester carboxylesterase